MLRAIIFDFDGVITDSEILHFRAFNEVLGPHGLELNTKDYYKTYLGLTDVDCFKLLIHEGKLQIAESDIGGLVAKKKVVFEKLARTEGKLIDGVRDCLAMLAGTDIPLAVCSGSLLPEIEVVLEDANLRPFFSVIVSAEQIKRGKPHPDGLLLTLKKLNADRKNPITPEQCIVIEDSNWGLDAAKAAGMHTVAVTNSYSAQELASAELIVSNLRDLTLPQLQDLCL